MRLQTKIIVLLIALFATYGAIEYTVHQQVVLPSFAALESDLARAELERASQTLDHELTQLLALCTDWSQRFESDELIRTHARGSIAAAKLDMVALLDRDSRIVWSAGDDARSSSPRRFKLLGNLALPPESALRRSVANAQQARGWIQTEYGPALIAVAPIRNIDGTGPARGTVLLGRILTPQLVATLAEQAQVNLRVLVPARQRSVTELVRQEHHNEVFRDVVDMAGNPILTLKVDVSRSISEHGRAAVRVALTALLIAGVIALSALLWALRRLILLPINHLTRHALSIGGSDDPTRRLNVRREDELGALAWEFDRMLERLAEARRRLTDKSLEAGAGELASGLLHNVGNALTPIAVKSSRIQSAFADAPTAELQRVLAELSQESTDPARRADLEAFLRLACLEMLNVTSNVAGDARSIAEGVQAIQAVLNDRTQFSRARPMIESARLADVVHGALRLVPPQKLESVDILIDDSVSAVGAVPLARVTVQQVFQNLIVNACEAPPKGGMGRITVSARLSGPEGDRKLHVTFADNGVGLSAEHLAAMFDKGFSTQPLPNNSGLGLHWSANVVSAMGGRIHAESSGSGAGAVIHVLLPLHKTPWESGAMAA